MGSVPQQRNEANQSEEKKFWQSKKLCRRQKQKKQINLRENFAASSTSAIGINSSGGSKKNDNFGKVFYNCNKKDHIS